MNDIASASDKGRRTIYTYFKSKREIFNAVIESETDQLLARLRVIVSQPVSAEEKLQQYIVSRFEMVKEIVSRNGSLRAGFFRDVRKVDRARKIIWRKEIAMLRDILESGVEEGVFDIADVDRTAVVLTHALQGIDVPYIRDNLADEGIDKYVLSDYMTTLILNGIKKR